MGPTVDLAISQLSLRRGARLALDGLTLDFPAGSSCALWGPAGCGKTSLLKVLAGLLRPTTGQVAWGGKDAWALGPEERRAAQARLCMIFQTDALFDSSSVLDNVLLPLVQREVPAKEARARAEEALERVGLLAHARKRPAELSGGMKKRAGIARALVTRPQVVLADDPFAGLDPDTEAQIARLLLEVSAGKTLVVALPDPVASLPVERTLHLVDGRLDGGAAAA